ncbi:unnamed protein product, partial [Meganyctiphanes norvegica]
MATSNNIESVEPVVSNNTEFIEPGLNSYELRWNDHIPYFTKVFQSLRDLNELTDVTFACEDGIVCAHKLVLSSCSAYLRILFARLGTPNPVIFLKNTPVSLVRHVLEFIYCGSVNVSKEELALVLNLGHSLQIRGLFKLKLSRDNDSCGDEIVDKLTKEREMLQEKIASDLPLLPGDVKKTQNNINIQPKTTSKIIKNQDNRNKKTNSKCGDEIVDKLTKERKMLQEKNASDTPLLPGDVKKTQNNINIQPKTTSKIIKNQDNRNKKTNSKSKKMQNSLAQKQNQNHKSKPKTKKIKSVIKQERGSKFKQRNISLANSNTNKKEVTEEVEICSKFKPRKIITPSKRIIHNYDPRLKQMLGKYCVEHGYIKTKIYFENIFGFKIPDKTLARMKYSFLSNPHN